MANKGGSYIKQKDGTTKLVQRTQPRVRKEAKPAVKPAPEVKREDA